MEIGQRLRLVIDTDAYCKLGAADLLAEAVHTFGATISDCGRLPALPYMLRKGSLRTALGDDISDYLASLSQTMPPVPEPSHQWLGAIARVHTIDPGEAQLIAASADYGLLVITGDKRALTSIREVSALPEALDKHMVSLEAILIQLYHRLGLERLRDKIGPLMQLDSTARACFLSSSPQDGLWSYFTDLEQQALPLRLWRPSSETPV